MITAKGRSGYGRRETGFSATYPFRLEATSLAPLENGAALSRSITGLLRKDGLSMTTSQETCKARLTVTGISKLELR